MPSIAPLESRIKPTRDKPPKEKHSSIMDIQINPNEINHYNTFSQEIPDEFKYTGALGAFSKLKLWDKTARDRWSTFSGPSWDKIPKDAQKVDAVFPNRKIVTNKVEQAAEKLRCDSFDYIDKNKSYAKAEDQYTNDDSPAKVIITKRTLIAKKMINKVVNEVGGNIGGDFKNDGSIEEDAKDVILNPGTELQKNVDENASVYSNENLKWKDCRKKKLFEHDPKPADCRQGNLGDCWLQSALIDILNKKGSKPIKDMFKDEGASGHVQVRLYKPNHAYNAKTQEPLVWKANYYRMLKRIPVNLIDESIYNRGALWVHYLQAAVAKSNINNIIFWKNKTEKSGNKETRDYSSAKGGASQFAWNMLLGGDVKYYMMNIKEINASANEKAKKAVDKRTNEKVNEVLMKNKPMTNEEKKEFIKELKNISETQKMMSLVDSCYNKIDTAIRRGKLISLVLKKFKESDEDMTKGLVDEHEYSVCGCNDENGIKYVYLINPWYNRLGRMYDNKGNVQEASFENKRYKKDKEGKLYESFKVKLSDIVSYIGRLTIEEEPPLVSTT